MKTNIIIFSILFYLSIVHCFGQLNFTQDYPDTLSKKRLYTVIATETISYAAGLYFLSNIWYKDHERVPFHWYNDSKGYLQMDKAGHAYSAYRESYSSYYALRWAGVSKKKALLYGAPFGLIFQTPIEIFDGLYEGWGFSWSDMGANAFGSALFIAQEALFDEQVVLMKFSYSPSAYPKYYPSGLGDTPLKSFFMDYNGHTYWLSASLYKITGYEKMPKWLNLAVGYSGNGMIKEFENPTYYRGQPFPHFDRYRQYLLSLDVDFTKIPTKKKWLQKVFRTINTIKIPFPTIEFNRIDNVRFRGIYF